MWYRNSPTYYWINLYIPVSTFSFYLAMFKAYKISSIILGTVIQDVTTKSVWSSLPTTHLESQQRSTVMRALLWQYQALWDQQRGFKCRNLSTSEIVSVFFLSLSLSPSILPVFFIMYLSFSLFFFLISSAFLFLFILLITDFLINLSSYTIGSMLRTFFSLFPFLTCPHPLYVFLRLKPAFEAQLSFYFLRKYLLSSLVWHSTRAVTASKNLYLPFVTQHSLHLFFSQKLLHDILSKAHIGKSYMLNKSLLTYQWLWVK